MNDYNIFTREFTGALEYLENLGTEILIAVDYNRNLLDVHIRDVVGLDISPCDTTPVN